MFSSTAKIRLTSSINGTEINISVNAAIRLFTYFVSLNSKYLMFASPTNFVTAPSPIVISAKEKYADCTIGTIKKISIPTIQGARKIYP